VPEVSLSNTRLCLTSLCAVWKLPIVFICENKPVTRLSHLIQAETIAGPNLPQSPPKIASSAAAYADFCPPAYASTATTCSPCTRTVKTAARGARAGEGPTPAWALT